MPSPKIDDFLRSVLSHVKFSFDKRAIHSELEGHLLDRIEEYLEQGYDEETAERLSVEGMGDPEEIGTELNKQHNPVIGWLWRLTHTAVVLLVAVNLFMIGIPLIDSLRVYDPAKDIPPTDIVYDLMVNEKVRLDDSVIKFTRIILKKNGELSIIYKYYDTRFWGTGWSFSGIGNISDNLGNDYWAGSGASNGGIVTRGIRTFENFDKTAEMLIISYENYNRSYRVEIPLKAGDVIE
ncbi:hypothetical protein Desde_2820 [Desulfitobacterium dehalogenans ATCC 51507]|uniref:Uncharacterized protein n=1 Tax=Desulfitobacterium dehalogenans (strain ATCC 51507 / DSM 9161 / JW/IU-DC1) TaxID=756499 RepID=I4AAZ0_DESDJ|nr:permease prefix domain 1-containing protein [Desulfitobacterium dehalogenans]AFM01125.1 hypothetical protein Desde_2820 [Desulfitobacterium dehalogenans ATCC 51507]